MGLLNVTLSLNELRDERRKHSKTVAHVAHTLATKVGLSSGFAYLCGLVHDIGYSVNYGEGSHNIKGFKLLQRNGIEDAAIVTLFHSRGEELDKYINGMNYKKELYEKVKPYIDLISTADSIVNSKGEIVGCNSRLADISYRYGKGSLQAVVGLKQVNDCKDWFKRYNIEYDAFLNEIRHKQLDK